MLKRLLCCLLLLACGMWAGYAQTQIPTTQGKEFWLSFMRNGYRTSTSTSSNHLTLIASAKHACTVTVTNSYTGYTNTFSVPDQGVHTLQIPDASGYNDQQSGVANKGLLVTSTDTISLYIANETQNSYDAANVLPLQALGYRYMVQTNKSLGEQSGHTNENRASFLIIATEDNTEVQITPSCLTWESHGPGAPYTVTLQRGQCYHVLNKNVGDESNSDGDLSGTWIECVNNKPIAVFNGNCITSVANESVSEGLDHVFEQAMPVDNWGMRFVVTKTATPSGYSVQNDRVKITALFDNTVVRRGDGSQLCQLNVGESYAFWLTETSVYLESTNPVAVYLYNHSHSSSNTYGDPSMVWISPVEQNLREVIFSTFTSTTDLNHFVNVVCYSEDASELCLNSIPIASNEIHAVPDAPQFSYARVPVSPGMNRLSCPGGLVAHVYGMGDRQGYAYTVGSSARILTNQLFVNDELVTEYSICQTETVDFRLETNYEPDLVKWTFGDGSPVSYGSQVSHAYNLDGEFLVEVVVDHEINGMSQSDTLGVTIHVNPKIELTCVDSTCNPVYFFQGIEFPVPFFGDSIISNIGGCETVYHMSISEGSSHSFVTYDTACLEYTWFDTIRYESGTYIVILNQPGGCDSLFILNLTIGKPPENPVRYKSSCFPYDWDGLLCETTDVYHHQYETEDYCVYDSVLYFTRYYEPSFEKIVGSNYVAVATNFWPGEYVYHLDDNTGLDAERLVWWLDDNDDPSDPYRWIIKPLGTSCTIIAYSQATKTLHVKYDGECPKERELVINCTGYAVDEQGILPLEVYPNPAKDELIVKGCEMEEVVLYNLLGQQLKSLAAQGDTEVKVHVGDLPQALYLLEIRTKYGNNTRLVSVIN